jgi:hypothetical protein
LVGDGKNTVGGVAVELVYRDDMATNKIQGPSSTVSCRMILSLPSSSVHKPPHFGGTLHAIVLPTRSNISSANADMNLFERDSL